MILCGLQSVLEMFEAQRVEGCSVECLYADMMTTYESDLFYCKWLQGLKPGLSSILSIIENKTYGN